MKPIENKCMLITYADSMGGNLKELEKILERYFPEEIRGLHILPFYPSSGDRGFAVVSYDEVDPRFGSYEDIRRMSGKWFLAADFMLNHISIRSREFRDYMEKGRDSEFRNMFIHWEEFWPEGKPTESDLKALYMRKPGGPKRSFTLENGERVNLWCTFFEEQVDINPHAPETQRYYERNLKKIASFVPMIRFDAFAYASKVPGTSCFFVEPEIWDVLEISTKPLKETGTAMLAEIHEEYRIQKKLAQRGHYVYDFALPLLLLHGITFGRTDRLLNWLRICPRNQVTTLDTHDGIGVVDAAGLLTDDEIREISTIVRGRYIREFTKLPESLQEKDPFWASRIKMSDGKEKIYQLGGTFFSAMDEDEEAYVLARAVQLFTPGIPQIYYVGLLAGTNDFSCLERGEGGREVNRHNFTEEEIRERVRAPFLQKMYALMRLRNSCEAFDGEFSASGGEEGKITMRWENRGTSAELTADFRTKSFTVCTEKNGIRSFL